MVGDPYGYSLPLSVQVPPSPSLLVQLPPMGSSFEKYCVERRAPADTEGNYENLTHDELHHLCSQCGYALEDSSAALQTRSNAMDAIE